jgi:hypothetical protein
VPTTLPSATIVGLNNPLPPGTMRSACSGARTVDRSRYPRMYSRSPAAGGPGSPGQERRSSDRAQARQVVPISIVASAASDARLRRASPRVMPAQRAVRYWPVRIAGSEGRAGRAPSSRSTPADRDPFVEQDERVIPGRVAPMTRVPAVPGAR